MAKSAKKKATSVTKKAAASANGKKSKKGSKASSASSKKRASVNVPMDVRIMCTPTGVACKHKGQDGHYVDCAALGLICVPGIGPDDKVTVKTIEKLNDGITLETRRATFSYTVEKADEIPPPAPRELRLENHQAIKTKPEDWKQ